MGLGLRGLRPAKLCKAWEPSKDWVLLHLCYVSSLPVQELLLLVTAIPATTAATTDNNNHYSSSCGSAAADDNGF